MTPKIPDAEHPWRSRRATPEHRGIGVFWWEPAVTGRLRDRGFFDDDGNALPVISVFDRWTRK